MQLLWSNHLRPGGATANLVSRAAHFMGEGGYLRGCGELYRYTPKVLRIEILSSFKWVSIIRRKIGWSDDIKRHSLKLLILCSLSLLYRFFLLLIRHKWLLIHWEKTTKSLLLSYFGFPVADRESRIQGQIAYLEGDPSNCQYRSEKTRQRQEGTNKWWMTNPVTTVGNWHLLLLGTLRTG